MSKSIHYFPSEVIEEECTKGGVVGTYLLNDVDGGTMSNSGREGGPVGVRRVEVRGVDITGRRGRGV